MSDDIGLLAAQRSFAAAVRGSDAFATLSLLAGDEQRNLALLAVYRGNAVANAGKALTSCYPVIMKIVGEEFFSGLCRAFWAVSPSRSGDLNEYGDGFADFLASFPHACGMPYLPDVARVEWRVSCAAGAADHAAAPLAALADIAPDDVGKLRFALQPGLSVLSSQWPVATIWQQHQSDYQGEIDINIENAECIAVHRRGVRVEVIMMGAGEGAVWRAAQQGLPLAAMLDAAFEADQAFDVQAALQRGFAREFVTSTILDD